MRSFAVLAATLSLLAPAVAAAEGVLDQVCLADESAGVSGSAVAQTFTVGVDGTLDSIEVTADPLTAELKVDVLPTVHGAPAPVAVSDLTQEAFRDAIALVSLGSVNETDVAARTAGVDPVPGYGDHPIRFDLRAHGIEVRRCDLLAVVLDGVGVPGSSAPTLWRTSWLGDTNSDVYAGGQQFDWVLREPAADSFWLDQPAADLRFRTFVDPEPKPSRCEDGVDDDGDGLLDLADPGCSDAADCAETDPSLACDDGIDDDGDGLVDHEDPACLSPTHPREDPQCDDGLDNDLDGGTDWDGAGTGVADADCKSAAERERPLRGPAIPGARFTPLGDLPGGTVASVASGVSPNGTYVVGSSGSDTPGGGVFRWDAAGGMLEIEAAPHFFTGFQDVSNDGASIVGSYVPENGLLPIPMRWRAADGIEPLLDFFAEGEARGISADGEAVVANVFRSSGDWTDALRWQAGAVVGLRPPTGWLGAFAARIASTARVAAGYAPFTPDSFSDAIAVRWDAQGAPEPLGYLADDDFWSAASGVSADGAFVAGYSSGFDHQEAFRWSEQIGMVGLGDVPGGATRSSATAVSADGAVLVGTSDGVAGPEAFVWDEVHGMRALVDVLELELGLDLTNWRLLAASDLSDDGRIVVGHGTNPSGATEAWVAELVPECANALDDDGDGAADFEDAGCASELDPSERERRFACDDGIDNDGDRLTDHPADPGCPFSYASPEDPPCDDGLDNDGDGAADGADSLCPPSWPYWEELPCGLGAELALALPGAWLPARRARRKR